jgi:hypothetical protein
MTSLASAQPAATQPALRARLDWRALALPGLLLAFVLLGCVYAVVTPLFEVSDELWHYPMVKTLADGQGLPVQNPAQPGPWRQEGSQPPLYYAVMAVATHWIDTSDLNQVRWINPHADNGIITPDGNNNIVIHTYRDDWPWWGTALAVRLIRFLSVLMGAGTVYFTYRLALEVLPGRRDVALAAAGLIAFTPMFVFISASVNNDNMAILLSAAVLWWLARWLRVAPTRLWEFALMGLLLGAAALSKTSALGLWPLAAGVVLWNSVVDRGRRTNDGGRNKVSQTGTREGDEGRGTAPQIGLGAVDQVTSTKMRKRWTSDSSFVTRPRSLLGVRLSSLGLMYAVALTVSGWWFVRNYILYQDWLGWNAFLDTVGRRPHPASLLQLWGERVGFVQAYWGLFGGVSVPMPDWVYLAFNAVAALASFGVIVGIALSLRRRTVDWNRVALWGLVVAWVAAILVGLVRWTALTWASQGRLIFPAISALGVLIGAGLARLWRGLPWPAVTFMGLVTALVPFTVIGPHYQPPPALSPAELAQVPNPLGAAGDFGEMKLLGYSLPQASVQPGQSLRLTLYWQAEIAMDRNWSIFVHVVDDQGVIVAQRDRYPGNGSLATTLLSAGQTFADTYVIPIPVVTVAPAAAHIEVGLYDLSDGTRLPLASGTDALALAPVMLAARPEIDLPAIGALPNPLNENFDNQIELIGYDLDRRAARPGDTIRVTLYWRARAPIHTNYSVFAHVRGQGETLWAGQDSWPQQGAAPTAGWQPGQVISDTHSLQIKTATPPGQYDLEVGLYDAGGQRLLQYDADGLPTDLDFVYLSRLRVEAP